MHNDTISFLFPLLLFAIGMCFIGWPKFVPVLHRHLLMKHGYNRPPDFIIGGTSSPYLLRWYLTPWSRYDRRNPPLWAQITKRLLPNIYLHHFLRSDDDRALHDHPWFNASILLKGGYYEHTRKGERILRTAGSLIFRSPWTAHRVELFRVPYERDAALWFELDCWTLFMTSPRVREWGFLCPKGWLNWQKFGDQNGCGES